MNLAGIYDRAYRRASGQTWQFVQMAIAVVCLYPAIGQAADTAQPLADLFEIGWKASPTDSTALKSQYYAKAQVSYKKAKADAPGDPRVDYAMAIVAAQNGHFQEAEKYLQEAPRPYEPPLFIRRLQVWLKMSRGDAATVQTDTVALAQAVAADTLEKHSEERKEIANWLGRVLGYYSGPGKNHLKDDARAKLDADLSASLTGPLAAACSEGQAAVAERYADLQGQLQAAQKEAKDQNEKEMQSKQDRISAQQNQMAADIGAATEQKNLAELAARQMQTKWVSDRRMLAAQLLERENEYRNVDVNLKRMKAEQSAELNKAPDKRDDKKLQTLSNMIRDEDASVEKRRKALQNDITNNRQRATLNDSNLGMAKQQYADRDKELKNLQASSEKLDSSARKLANQTQNSVSNSDKETKKLLDGLTSINTYAPVDLTKNKERILNSFPKADLTPSTK
jgi:hypothetical protein